MAERLGTGLQNLLQQFESAWYLHLKGAALRVAPFVFIFAAILSLFISWKI